MLTDRFSSLYHCRQYCILSTFHSSSLANLWHTVFLYFVFFSIRAVHFLLPISGFFLLILYCLLLRNWLLKCYYTVYAVLNVLTSSQLGLLRGNIRKINEKGTCMCSACLHVIIFLSVILFFFCTEYTTVNFLVHIFNISG